MCARRSAGMRACEGHIGPRTDLYLCPARLNI